MMKSKFFLLTLSLLTLSACGNPGGDDPATPTDLNFGYSNPFENYEYQARYTKEALIESEVIVEASYYSPLIQAMKATGNPHLTVHYRMETEYEGSEGMRYREANGYTADYRNDSSNVGKNEAYWFIEDEPADTNGYEIRSGLLDMSEGLHRFSTFYTFLKQNYYSEAYFYILDDEFFGIFAARNDGTTEYYLYNHQGLIHRSLKWVVSNNQITQYVKVTASFASAN